MIDLPQLQAAIAANHTEWFQLIAQHSGGQMHQHDGVTWIYKASPIAEVTIAFPKWSLRQSAHCSRTLDHILDWCRAHAPIHQVSCWCIDGGQPIDLGARLVARGFGWGWQPHWMWLNLRTQTLPQLQLDGVQIQPENDVAGWTLTGETLPNFEPPEVEAITTLMRRHPQEAGYFVARMNGRVVGHCAALISEQPIKMAGLYDVGVVPSARRRGIGLALVLMACAWAKAQGCLDVTLNSTPMGRSTYRRAGFVSLGDGQTWWLREADLNQQTLQFAPLNPAQIKLVEALGGGNVVAAEQYAHAFTVAELNAPLMGRSMTLAALIQQMRQPVALDWLARHGANAAMTTRVIPRIGVRQIESALAFYVQRLGFRMGYVMPGFAIVQRGEVELHLLQLEGRASAAESPSYRLLLRNLDDLWREYQERQVLPQDHAIARMPWGGREFSLMDVDHNTLIFTEE